MGVRCFIAVPLSDDLRKEIAACVVDLKKTNADVNWVRTENLHITLKFLGDTDEASLRPLQEGLLMVSASLRPFTVGLSGVGLFPGKARPRVIWIGMQDYRELAELQEAVEDKLVSLGLPKEDRPFSPHLTIGRVRTPKNLNAILKGLEALEGKDFGIINVQSFSLMKSVLKPTGAEYTPLKEFDLK